MKTTIVGAGPGGLYAAILLRKADPASEVTVLERNRLDDTFGFGVVLSDATRETLAELDPRTFEEIERRSAHWDDIDIHYKGHKLVSTGHGFSGISRQVLLDILARRARELGADLRFQREVRSLEELRDSDLIVAADGVNSTLRGFVEKEVRPSVEMRPNRFVWLGTDQPLTAFTFHFPETEHGLWRLHSYPYDERRSTFIVETTERTWRNAGLDKASEDETVAFCEKLFETELGGHRLFKNRSLWRQFPIVKCAHWHSGNVALLGDAAHTTHFSIGSGTKLAMEDAQALVQAVTRESDIGHALKLYEQARRPQVESFQRAAHVSLTWFEDTERYMRHEPIQFAFSLLTRSFRVTHEELQRRDPGYVASVDRWFAERAAKQSGVAVPLDPPPPPMFTPYRVRDLVLQNRIVVSPMCMYSADDGTINDWHLVHLGSRLVGGAGLVIAEMTDVSREGRITPGCAGLYKDEHVEAWRRVTEFAHRWTSAKIGVQLGHAGRKAATTRPWEKDDNEPLEIGAWPIVAPSALPYFPDRSQTPREMSREDMDKVLTDYVDAAKRAEKAGFDWLELHYAHGYLMATFLSPLTNRRRDEYGGSLENRLRFPLEVFDAVRRVWPAAKPMSVRISAVDWAPGGNESNDAVAIARAFKEHGVDIMDVSAGQTVPDAKPVYGRQFQTPFSERVRIEAGVPTMTVGNISSYSDVNTILIAGRADLCVLARAHLYDPYWARHAAAELGHAMPWPPQYESLQRYKARFK
ncbi:MAG TPA: bifunctional salicylyl-CoA 5-hydroxylase/oxidoreductase [Candidatus Thermoplasmatota archaeon]|nr:bifunctional salicylyl-CoA 5-hydroxylase/oxidoreductase [Candidatus Thermoplasmatota archaeon]